MLIAVYDVFLPMKTSRLHKRMFPTMIWTTASAKGTERLGATIAKRLLPGDILLLHGPLGSGKTTLMKGLARSLGVRTPIVSPTFVLRKRYPLPDSPLCALNHLDAYRLRRADELWDLLEDELRVACDEVWCIEWGKRLTSVIPLPRVRILEFSIVTKNRRRVRLSDRSSTIGATLPWRGRSA